MPTTPKFWSTPRQIPGKNRKVENNVIEKSTAQPSVFIAKNIKTNNFNYLSDE